MLDMGFIPDVIKINKLLPKIRQTLFFSATRVQAESILPVLDTFISEERTKLSIGDDQLIYEATQHVHHSFLKYFVTLK